jgi:uncharacterized membrane protein
MTRKKYVAMFPAMIVGGLILGYVLTWIFPSLPTYSILVFVAAVGAIIILVDRVLRARVDEPLNDERIQGIAERAAWLSYRISSIILGIGGGALIFVPLGREGFRLLGIGAWIAVALESLVFTLAYHGLQARKS